MKISIITVVWNRRESIADCLTSVASQTYADIEHVIVDGGSTDGTVQVIQSCPRKPGPFVSESDKGIYNAINKAINLATGDYVGLLHADDLFDNDTVIEDIVSQLKMTQADMLYGDLEYVSAKDTTKVIRYWKSGEFYPGIMKRGWMPPHPTVFVRRSLFAKLGPYREDMKIAADYEWLLRWIQFGGVKPVYLPKVVTRMRVGGASNKSLKNLVRKTSEDLRAWRVNGVTALGFLVILKKNISKIPQFMFKR